MLQKKRYNSLRVFIWVLCMQCFACTLEDAQNGAKEQFALLQSDRTGLIFRNSLTSTKEFNIFHYMYFYNGGGVAVADFNQDGLQDIFFTANMDSNALFLNRGDLRFENVTFQAALTGQHGWTTGACAVDINQDGLMDIYVNQLGDFRTIKGRNQLYICDSIDRQGIPRFTDRAPEFGLDLIGFGTQAAFFDYDRDGDLDMYQLNHSVHNNGTFGQRHVFQGTYHDLSGDRLLRNDNGVFVDVTRESGIHSSVIGYGLGVATGDLNNDGWPDIYICNDFHENDYLYLNQQNGTFREVLTDAMAHTSRFSMGVDIADFNNDGWNDVVTMDMHPYDPVILKSSLGEDGFGTFQFKLGYGYHYQYARNTLQINRGNNMFSDIAPFAGVYNTDWSWAALFFDFDHDGNKDLFVSNGIPKRMNDIDYVNFVSNQEVQWKIRMDEMEDTDLALEEKLPEVKIPNKFFKNTGDLRFAELRNIRADASSFSNGAAYADFDNDGDLDVVVNNIGDDPYLYQNLTMENSPQSNAYLKLRLTGPVGNLQAIGARVVAYKKDQRLVKELFPVTGYQSSVSYDLHIGLGPLAEVDSMHLIWPDGTFQRLGSNDVNRMTELQWKPGLPIYTFSRSALEKSNYAEVTDITNGTALDFVHRENQFVEFDRETLIPHMTSTQGPPVAVGDVNNDGLQDVYIGGAKFQTSVLYLQNRDGMFIASQQAVFRRDSLHEDVDAIFLDVDNDGDEDLVVASGGNEFRNQAEPMTQRLYRNNGEGQFLRDTAAFRDIYMTAACIAASDFDADGDMDLFIGGRAEPWHYGVFPRSYLLENNGHGIFTDVTASYSKELEFPGLVRDAEWADVDGNGNPDLIVAAEWGPIAVYYQSQRSLKKVDIEGSSGLWNVVRCTDVDNDGDPDIIAGNLGLNSELTASPTRPLRLYVNDFDKNDRIEQLLTYYLDDQEVLFHTYAEIMQQLPILKKKFLFARDFANARIGEIIEAECLKEAKKLEVHVLEHSWFENRSQRQFERHSLPLPLQLTPLHALLIRDFNGDSRPDLFCGGNFYEVNIEMGRYDSDFGNILFAGKNGFSDGDVQSLNIKGQIRNIGICLIGGQECVLVARNDAPIMVIQVGQGRLDL